MLKKSLFVFLCLLPLFAFSQKKGKLNARSNPSNQKTISDKDKDKAASSPKDSVATIDMYKIISFDRDTTYVDTALTLKKEYEVNYLRKDNFGLLSLSNDGGAYNVLDFGLNKFDPFPQMGFKAKHVAYQEVEDIKYYNVATPYTDLMYRSVLGQGQILDAFITLNTSENLNFSAGYKGLRSLGRYINELSSNGIFKLSGSYNTTDKRYVLRAHFTGQDFSNQENGGIVEPELFEQSDPPFNQRERLEVYMRDGKSVLKGNRYFVDHTFRLSKTNPNSLVFHHQFNYENKSYEFSAGTNTSVGVSERFGDSYASIVNNKTRYNRMYNLIGAAYANEKIGKLEFYLDDFRYNYFYKSVIIADGQLATPNSISDDIVTYGAKYIYQKDKWKGSVLVSNSITDQSLANIEASVRYKLNDDFEFSGKYQNMNKLPDNNYQLYQSTYKSYNWPYDVEEDDNGLKTGFKNEKINNFEFEAKTKWLNASVQYSILNDHLFFNRVYPDPAPAEDEVEPLFVRPQQFDGTINYLSVKANREFRLGKFALDNTVLFQNVQQSANVLNVPSLLTRNTLYYTDRAFKKALFFQTGVTFQYFTEYYTNGYNPVIGEFYSQDATKTGNFPLIDFFINAKIQEFRLFIKAEHLNSSFSGYNYFSAPNYPYMDFTIRFGVVWDFFS
ncbi:putative porin [Flavobacterium sp. AG291]|uniref:putative porin n=1 Tax=Flavobacterium sp. AG291 TaxID=2184000 RepID=UPI000E0B325F|nr:putative porin [Flavobacterium sp. AG291]RDI16062.1 putative beta-barrel porin [Flavobacterium sp. AG291]